MFVDPADLAGNLDRLEEIEKASLRLVTQAILDFREVAADLFGHEKDLPQDFGEDVTREALDRMGVSRIDQRIYGKIDYKRARYVFHPEYAIRQALLVDSKAEKPGGAGQARLQTAQTSMRIRQVRAGVTLDVPGTLPTVLSLSHGNFLTTTIFVKYTYESTATGNILRHMTIAALPNGLLQDRYNPHAGDNIWNAGPDAPTLGENFRVRLVFAKLSTKKPWRVQRVPIAPAPFAWIE